jgi:hypothetical protein
MKESKYLKQEGSKSHDNFGVCRKLKLKPNTIFFYIQMALKHASIPETITIMECCVCFENVKPEEAYKFWECDQHYTCRQCGTSLKTCPLCRAPADSAVRRRDRHRSAVRRRAHSLVSAKNKIREDWREEAIIRGLWNTRPLSIEEDHNDNKCIIQSWNTEGRTLLSKRWATKLNVRDVRLSW